MDLLPRAASIVSVAAICLGSASAAAVALVDRVLVIRNADSPISQAVAGDYLSRRGVTRVLDVKVPDAAVSTNNESISFKDFQTKIEQPLRAYLAAHPEIDFIVMTKGVPIRLNGAQALPSSLDSYVSALDYDKLPGAIRVISEDPNYRAPDGGAFHGVSWANRYWNSRKPFTHAEFGGYLVTRLDGYTQADAIALTTRSLAAETLLRGGRTPTAPFLLDQDPTYGLGDKKRQPYSVLKADPPVRDTARIPRESDYDDWNADMALAADSLRARKLTANLDAANTFAGDKTALMGYASWGSNDRHFDQNVYAGLRFDPGGIVETAVSTSARTFLPTQGGQSLVADIIHGGATGMKGYTDEPFLQAIASPSILFSRYAAGWTLAESYYAASNQVGWEDIVIGDPILRAFPQEGATALAPAAPKAPSRKRIAPKGHEGAFMLRRAPGSAPVTVLGATPRG